MLACGNSAQFAHCHRRASPFAAVFPRLTPTQTPFTAISSAEARGQPEATAAAAEQSSAEQAKRKACHVFTHEI
jgi:hypothetical protein